MNHALVVGGTGMLTDVSLWLSSNDYHVSIIAQNKRKMENLILKSSNKSRITPVLVDYRQEEKLKEKLFEISRNHGGIQLVVAWIHSDADQAFSIINQVVAETVDHWRMFHILGSSTNLNELKQELHAADNCSYHQIQLGFIRNQNQSRWLTHSEISNGIIDAIKNDHPTYIVGMIKPWELRP